jgi:Membrane bound O-acyl transferase family
MRGRRAVVGVALLIVLPAMVLLFLPETWPRWAVMWSLVAGIFMGCKWLTWYGANPAKAPWWRHAGYLLAWPGLDADAFLNQQLSKTDKPSLREWLAASINLLAGVVLFWKMARAIPEDHEIFRGWVGMVGLILMLHFGSFHLLSCAWRTIGVRARPLMNKPIWSASLSEFWGKRWNTAFRDTTYRFLFQPLSRHMSPQWAVGVGFFLSGLVHDLVISVPSGGGYGGPTVFFIVQGASLLAERSAAGRSLGLGRGWTGGLFTKLALVLPVYGLFHPPFIRNVILPFMQALGAT